MDVYGVRIVEDVSLNIPHVVPMPGPASLHVVDVVVPRPDQVAEYSHKTFSHFEGI